MSFDCIYCFETVPSFVKVGMTSCRHYSQWVDRVKVVQGYFPNDLFANAKCWLIEGPVTMYYIHSEVEKIIHKELAKRYERVQKELFKCTTDDVEEVINEHEWTGEFLLRFYPKNERFERLVDGYKRYPVGSSQWREGFDE